LEGLKSKTREMVMMLIGTLKSDLGGIEIFTVPVATVIGNELKSDLGGIEIGLEEASVLM